MSLQNEINPMSDVMTKIDNSVSTTLFKTSRAGIRSEIRRVILSSSRGCEASKMSVP